MPTRVQLRRAHITNKASSKLISCIANLKICAPRTWRQLDDARLNISEPTAHNFQCAPATKLVRATVYLGCHRNEHSLLALLATCAGPAGSEQWPPRVGPASAPQNGRHAVEGRRQVYEWPARLEKCGRWREFVFSRAHNGAAGRLAGALFDGKGAGLIRYVRVHRVGATRSMTRPPPVATQYDYDATLFAAEFNDSSRTSRCECVCVWAHDAPSSAHAGCLVRTARVLPSVWRANWQLAAPIVA